MRRIRFKQLGLRNYKVHRSLTVNYGDITKLSGKNGEGKSSIGEAPAWVFFGTDLFGGSKYNPTPTNYEFDVVHASLLISVDGVDYLLTREIVKGSNKYYLNEVPVKEGEYSGFVQSLFDKETFLSLYYPLYFFSLHKDKQRDLLLRNLLSPANSEVFAEMSRTCPEQKQKEISLNPQAARLADSLKKHSIDQLASLYTDLKNKSDKLHIQAQGSVKTLTRQLQELGETGSVDQEAVISELASLKDRIEAFDTDRQKVAYHNNEIRTLQLKIEGLTKQIEAGKKDYDAAVAQVIDQECRTCGQLLTEEAKGKAEQAKKDTVKYQAEKVNPLIRERKALREKLAELKPLPEPEYSVSDLVARSNELNALLQSEQSRIKVMQDLEKARNDEAAYLQAKNDSIFVLDAIKAFKAKEAELQTQKVQDLFTTLSVRLFKYVKTSGEYVSDFMIQMDGKDYVALSAGEKIAAGLELTEVLFKQSELIVPCFIDGIGEYTGKVAVYDQLITGRAVEGQELKIETEKVGN
ncbi:AAA family ATPase [Paenibacillus ehimensis]|uniref:AAA family ATPase n=1 Tax=Paenibacillus ehimensis TaxID=79264 RepID=A0ABT8VI59_9BACL|nr:AAA family ATPase [Paenibacillus ehimensis]MDO3680674.1 AAA family ATPase [Paenibacillus ehimensis]